MGVAPNGWSRAFSPALQRPLGPEVRTILEWNELRRIRDQHPSPLCRKHRYAAEQLFQPSPAQTAFETRNLKLETATYKKRPRIVGATITSMHLAAKLQTLWCWNGLLKRSF